MDAGATGTVPVTVGVAVWVGVVAGVAAPGMVAVGDSVGVGLITGVWVMVAVGVGVRVGVGVSPCPHTFTSAILRFVVVDNCTLTYLPQRMMFTVLGLPDNSATK